MRVELFRFLAVFASSFCLLGGFALGGWVGEQVLESGVIGIGIQDGWPSLTLVLGLGSAGAALGALVQHRLVPWLGAAVLSDEAWRQHAASLAAKSGLFVVLFTVFMLPFFCAGIVFGFAAGMGLARAGLFGLEPNGWPIIFVSLGIAGIGIYLGALIGYTLFLLIGTVVLGRERLIKRLEEFPKEPQAQAGFISRLLARPFSIISNRMLGTND